MKERKVSEKPRQDSRGMVHGLSTASFYLDGEDPLAPDLVRLWADRREAAIREGSSPFTDFSAVVEARTVADIMDRRLRRIDNPKNVEHREWDFDRRDWPEIERLLYGYAEDIRREMAVFGGLSELTVEKVKRILRHVEGLVSPNQRLNHE